MVSTSNLEILDKYIELLNSIPFKKNILITEELTCTWLRICIKDGKSKYLLQWNLDYKE